MTRYEHTILQMINDSSEHLTADDIYQRLREAMPGVVRATVYNNLNRLCEQGEIVRLKIGDGSDHYDKKIRHDHLVCRRCGKIRDLAFTDLSNALIEAVGDPGLSYDLTVTWTCPDCK